MNPKNILKLIAAIGAAELAGIIGAIFTTPNISTWYAALAKPSLAPPNWVFGPVWILLYALMGVALFLVWKRHSYILENVRMSRWRLAGIVLFFAQLALNVFWSYIFFGRQNPGAAFIEIIFLWLAILAAIIAFAKVSRRAAWLLFPYILWVSFAGYLNYEIWRLNRAEPSTCTQEAKLCSDGSYVGRTGPNCEFAQCSETRNVKLYYYNPALDQDAAGNIACSRSGLAAVEREIAVTQTPIQDTIKLLLTGQLTAVEKSRGLATEYPLTGFSLEGADLRDGILTLEFSDPNNRTVGGACRTGILWFQIEATAKQFLEVEQVRFLPEDLFQP